MCSLHAAQRLIFVYNADEGFFNALTDTTHKIFSPETYQCSLCRFTYGLTGMLLPWKQFIDSLGIPPVFFHRKEFREAYPDLALDLPVILFERDGRREVVLSTRAIAGAGGLDGLIEAVKQRLALMAPDAIR